MKGTVGFIVSLIFIGVLLLLLRQLGRVQQLEIALNAAHNENANMLLQLSEASRNSTDPSEMDRLLAAQSEALKLRAEISRLKQQLTVEAAAPRTVKQVASNEIIDGRAQQVGLKVAPLPEDNPAVAVHKTPIIKTAIGTNATLVVGGWHGESGKRVFGFIQATRQSEDPSQVLIGTLWLELSDDAARKMRYGLPIDSTGDQTAILADISIQQLRRENDELGDGRVLSSPRAMTIVGQQTELSASEPRETEGGRVTLGHAIDLIPTIAGDGLVQLSLRATMVEGRTRIK